MMAPTVRALCASIALAVLGACAPEPAAPPATVPAQPAAAAPSGYQKPPQNVLDVLHAPLPPYAWLNPTHDTLILSTPVRYPPIAELAEPMHRLAGARVRAK